MKINKLYHELIHLNLQMQCWWSGEILLGTPSVMGATAAMAALPLLGWNACALVKLWED